MTAVILSLFAVPAYAQTTGLGTADLKSTSSDIMSLAFGGIGTLAFIVAIIFIVLKIINWNKLFKDNTNKQTFERKIHQANIAIILAFVISVVSFMAWAIVVFRVCCSPSVTT